MSPAWEPVKKVLIPRAASVPLVSVPKANCVLAPAEMVNLPRPGVPGAPTLAVSPLTPLIAAARLSSVVVWPGPSRGTGMLAVVLAPVCVFVTMICSEPLVGAEARPAWSSGASGSLTALRLVVCV